MTRSEPIAVFGRKSKLNRDWLEDEFFDTPATRDALMSCAEHFEDIVENNTVCTDQERLEFAKRAKYLRRLAKGLSA